MYDLYYKRRNGQWACIAYDVSWDRLLKGVRYWRLQLPWSQFRATPNTPFSRSSQEVEDYA